MRLVEIESSNLNIFEFDYDLTMMVFFLSPDEKVYARYGGRCAKGPDARHSLAGLRYTMESVLKEHASGRQRFSPMLAGKPFYITEVAPKRGLGRCIHCHQVKEVLYNELDSYGLWDLDLAFRYPPPDNLGLTLRVDRGNVVETVLAGSPAAKAGIQTGDVITTLNRVPIHSFGDAQYALDRARKTESIGISWQRDESLHRGALQLPAGWRRTDISWRPSLQNLVASAEIYGDDLTPEEKTALGIPASQLAFRQMRNVPEQGRKAGIRAGDIIIGLDDKTLAMTAYEFLKYVRRSYVKGETVIVNVIRNEQRLRLPMKLE